VAEVKSGWATLLAEGVVGEHGASWKIPAETTDAMSPLVESEDVMGEIEEEAVQFVMAPLGMADGDVDGFSGIAEAELSLMATESEEGTEAVVVDVVVVVEGLIGITMVVGERGDVEGTVAAASPGVGTSNNISVDPGGMVRADEDRGCVEETAAAPPIVAIAGALSTSTGDAALSGEAESVHAIVSEGATTGVGGEDSAVSE